MDGNWGFRYRQTSRHALELSLAAMSALKFLIATGAHERHAVEGKKCFCLVAFSQESLLAVLAPCLKIVWIVAVLNKTNHMRSINHVTTDNGRNKAIAMRSAINHERVELRHGE
jgi:hypothetical protein